MKSFQAYFLVGLLGLLLCCNLVFGQVKFDLENDFNELYKIDYWNAETHDFSNTVLSMLQSQDGYIWLGTFDGLYKFDGIDFERIDTKKENEDGFANHGFRAILEDSRHNIWFGTNGNGVSFYDAKEKRYKIIQGKGIESETVFALNEDENGDILVGTRKNLFRIHNEQVETVSIGELENPVVQFFSRDEEGILWLATRDNGLIALKSGNIIHHYSTKNGLKSNKVYSCLKDTNGVLWVATEKGLSFLKDGRFVSKAIKYPLNTSFPIIRSIYDHDGLLWLSTDEGLFCLKGEEQFPFFYLLGSKILFTKEDRDGNMWVGTYREGLVRLKRKKFLAYTEKNGLNHQVVNVLAEDEQKNIWIGSNTGLSLWNNNTFTNFKESKGLIKGRVRGIFPAKDRVWFGIYGGISYYQNGKIHPFEANKQLENNHVRAIYFDEDKKDLWIGTTKGLYCYTSEKKMLSYGKKDIGNTNIISINPSSQGLAIGTDGGGVIFYKDGKFKKYTTKENIGGNVVFGLYEDRQNNIWIATNGGLTLMQGNKLTTFRKSDGFYSNTIFHVMEDEQNNLWFTSNKSVFSTPKHFFLDFKEGETKNLKPSIFTIEDGLPSSISHVSIPLKTKDSWLIFPCMKGIGLIKPSTIKINPTPPKVHITSIELSGESVNFDTSKLTLSTKNKHIKITFKALSYANPKQVLFKYRFYTLGEENPKWRETSLKEINYGNLAAGDYIFELSAANRDGIWNENSIKIEITKEQYFYKTITFFISILLFLALIATLIYYRHLIQHKKAKIKLEKLVVQRTSEITKLAVKVEKHNEELTESYLEISDSINYAKQIQNAILRDDNIFKNIFTDFFIFWKAKDIVSGDFYWAVETQGKIIITVADCTGHGVAGAFMTILGSSTLDKIVINDGIIQPSEILKKLDEQIYTSLHKSDKYKRVLIHEGMDISVCSLDYKTKEFIFSGAKSRAFYFRNNEMTVLDGDRFSVGDKRKRPARIKENKFSFELGDKLYLFSDGYADQFGGEHNFKYMTHRLIKLVKGLQHLNMKEQKKVLMSELQKWQGNQPQIDDILFVGIEF
jgi:ligand-binding sensor domain-containing protein/serine phosphatase RsbU (regulator of sigma subunit)